ncbi:uncharacterized protein LOC128355940 [Scomber scombrus]|uniref:Uncharacterized protein LOC128355940 n=1 Tax=Scomber scombrus TaxID=13677 RepID=A0AAV1P664_SCOSC|nr:titin [Scomber scombrus]
METQTEKQRPNYGQLISVPHKDTIRLLEVYVKRSLSLNEGALRERRTKSKEKWVTIPRRQRRHSSDPSLHLADGLNDERIGTFAASESPTTQPEAQPEAQPEVQAETQPDTYPEEPEKPTKKSKKIKKPRTFWKSFLGLFSRKGDEEPESSSEMPEASPSEPSGTCLSTTPVTVQKKKSTRKRSLKRRFSRRRLSNKSKQETVKDLNPEDITMVETVSVQPTYSYYEKVSEELEKIVHEVKVKEEVETLTDEEVINRIIALTKEEGDAIEYKLKDNPTLSNFFQGMSYSCFQKLADAYLAKETTPTNNPPTVLPTAPELVKLAFTLDFTARIAGLSRQNICHITGLGNRYLQDRFEYNQACTDHPWSDSDD